MTDATTHGARPSPRARRRAPGQPTIARASVTVPPFTSGPTALDQQVPPQATAHADAVRWPSAGPWADAPSAEALQLLAEGITRFAGFETASISLLRADDMECVAVSGEGRHAGAQVGMRTPLLTSLPRPGSTGEASGEVRVLELHSDTGELCGTLMLRRAGTAPRDLTQERMLEHFTEQARRAVLTALEREELSQRMSIARSTRRALRYATTRRSLESIAEECRTSLQDAFRASEVWLRLIDRPPHGAPETSGPIRIGQPSVESLMRHLERRSWDLQEPVVLTRDRPASDLLEPDEVVLLGQVMDDYGIASALLAPIGAGEECLGRLVLCRGPNDQPWSTVEAESALDVGYDLGRAVLNARTWEREQQLVDRLRALDTYKTQLIATVAHELKTPLTSVLGNLELIEDGMDPEHARFALGAAHRGAGRLGRLVDDLLMLSSVTDSTDRSAWEVVDLVAVAHEVRDLTAASAARAEQRVVVETPSEPAVVHGDRRQLDHVVTNLVTNALKYSPAGRTVRVRFERAGAEVLLACADEGIGIAESDREQLFAEFFRSADPAARAQSGTGLGLSIVARIVDRHDGGVEVHSEPGVGSTFVVRLPGLGA